MRIGKPALFAVAVLACAALAWALVSLVGGPSRRAGVPGMVTTTGTAKLGGPFSLVDHTGKRVTDADFRGRFMVVYFGYTFCPDVCPTELQAMVRALERLGAKAGKVTPVFISVDPGRDTPAALKDYVAAFSPHMVGLTGTKAEIDEVTRAYRVYYRIGEPSRPGAKDYLVDHSSFIYLMGPDGKFRGLFRTGTPPDVLAEGIKSFL